MMCRICGKDAMVKREYQYTERDITFDVYECQSQHCALDDVKRVSTLRYVPVAPPALAQRFVAAD